MQLNVYIINEIYVISYFYMDFQLFYDSIKVFLVDTGTRFNTFTSTINMEIENPYKSCCQLWMSKCQLPVQALLSIVNDEKLATSP